LADWFVDDSGHKKFAAIDDAALVNLLQISIFAFAAGECH
jgi:hypothetical protein